LVTVGGERWKQLDEDSKNKYNEEYYTEKKEYDRLMKEHNEKAR